jgi:hypothetical protein
MALPKIKHPTYTVTIPSTQETITMKPFTVQEEKILLMARSSEKSEDIISAVKQIIQNCIIEPVDVSKLATFDIEYLFVKLRAKSIGEIVDLEYNDEETQTVVKFSVNLEEVEIKYNPNHSDRFYVADDIGIKMRYPTLEEIKYIENSEDQDKAIYTLLFKCVESIYDNETAYNEFTEKEFQDFVDTLPMDAMTKIRNFFETLPSLEHTVTLTNKEGRTKEIVLKGINSFFTS